MPKYSIGVDFGSLSGRSLLVNLENGAEIAASVYDYAHGVMDAELPCGEKLGADFALQHPQDYLEVLKHTIPDVLKQAGVSPGDVIGVGIDFTACTILPVTAEGTPLCFLDEYKSEPHAYVKLWKHHAAQKQADKINALARETGEGWLKRYGGKISSEWMFPKILQILEENPEIYARTARFIEAGDWVVWQLCGRETHSSCAAGYKAVWHKKEKYPKSEFWKKLNPKMENIIGTKISTDIIPVGGKAGGISPFGAELTGLAPDTAVAAALVDAHVALPALEITGPGKMLMIMGTSTCHIVMGNEEKTVPGMCGVVEDGVLPGFFGYEAGQSCVGDHFDWFVKNSLPESYAAQARNQGKSVYAVLSEKAARLKPGESGLVAREWWNGNRRVLGDAD
jgi:L-ribulokinase